MKEVRKEISRRMKRTVGGLLQVVTDIAFGSGKATGTAIQGDSVEMEVGYHYGFYSVPNDGASGFMLSFFGLKVLICYRDPSAELSLQKGEVGMKAKAGGQLVADKDGNLKADKAAGKTVQLAGTDYKLPKWDSFLSDHGALKDALTAIQTALTTNCVNGAPLMAPGSPGLVTLSAFITALGTDTYKSENVTNG